jgi:hypothetical protein
MEQVVPWQRLCALIEPHYPADAQKALDEAIKNGDQPDRIKSLRALLKVIKQGGTMSIVIPSLVINVLREECSAG